MALFGGKPIRIFLPGVRTHQCNGYDRGYVGEDSSIELKSEFILSLCEIAVAGENMGAKGTSIVDRCTRRILNGQRVREG